MTILQPEAAVRALFRFAMVVLLTGCGSGAPIQKPDSRPNILLIVADDLGWNDPGFMGNGYHLTPRLDALAREGKVFVNAYANAANCAPSRASLLTGQYAPRHGIYTVGNPARGKSENRQLIPVANRTNLDPSHVTIAEALQTSGYRTAFFGKWHLGGEDETLPTGQGFDTNVAGTESGHPRSYFSPYQNRFLEDGPTGEYLTDRVANEVIGYLEKDDSAPFFVQVSFFSVHTPIQGKPEKTEKYAQRESPHERSNPGYAAMVESLDENIGRILASLRDSGQEDNTLVVFTSDNGPYYPVTSAAPLRGSKGMLYEGGVRVPLIFRWPGTIATGTREIHRVMGIDLFPTFLSAAGVPGGNFSPDGVSLMPVLSGLGGLPQRPLFWHFPAYLEPYGGMQQQWRQTPAGSIVKGEWKLIESFETGQIELYDLDSDPAESVNLAEKMPELAALLTDELIQWRINTGAEVPTEKNPEYVPKE